MITHAQTLDQEWIAKFRGLVQAVKAHETLTVAAAVSGSRSLALQALLGHPQTMLIGLLSVATLGNYRFFGGGAGDAANFATGMPSIATSETVPEGVIMKQNPAPETT